MRKAFGTSMIFLLIFGAAGFAFAHFGMLIPSDSMVMQEDNRTITLKLSFSHPFEGVGMELVKPKVFSVFAHTKTHTSAAAHATSHTLSTAETDFA